MADEEQNEEESLVSKISYFQQLQFIASYQELMSSLDVSEEDEQEPSLKIRYKCVDSSTTKLVESLESIKLLKGDQGQTQSPKNFTSSNSSMLDENTVFAKKADSSSRIEDGPRTESSFESEFDINEKDTERQDISNSSLTVEEQVSNNFGCSPIIAVYGTADLLTQSPVAETSQVSLKKPREISTPSDNLVDREKGSGSRFYLAESGTQSTVYSSRWTDYIVLDGIHTSESSATSSTSDQQKMLFNIEKDPNGWDEKWSAEENLLHVAASEDASLFHQIELSLINENLDLRTCQMVWTSFSKWDNLELAPSCERVKRRLLHRPSQQTTQTAAAPLSSLGWIRRLHGRDRRQVTDNRLPSQKLDDSGVAQKILHQCRELNLASIGNDKLDPYDLFVCGWINESELNNLLASIMAKLRNTPISEALYRFERSGPLASEKNGGDCVDLLCYVEEVNIAANICRELKQNSDAEAKYMQTHWFPEASPMCGRFAGPWKAAGRHVILDIKFATRSSHLCWVVRCFFSKYRAQIQDIMVTFSSASSNTAREGGNFGLVDFAKCVISMQERTKVTSWAELLLLYANNDL
jgi:hypothetical protein